MSADPIGDLVAGILAIEIALRAGIESRFGGEPVDEVLARVVFATDEACSILADDRVDHDAAGLTANEWKLAPIRDLTRATAAFVKACDEVRAAIAENQRSTDG